MADELDRSLKSRFSFVETNPIYVIATLLNPSFSFLFNDPEESVFYERVPQSNINIEPSNKSSTPTKSYLFMEKPLTFVYEEKFQLNGFWKVMESSNPKLAKFAKKIFTTPATSASNV
ncbi:hypothetical protein BpHYR1_008191 [Brachionus plicatilis]|uniref:HAT C-terminal dimerisation domain-containing protein n=1 Tax=Brachionus plicatilis TaxID=10195 RepID=A0A3M7SSQ9_BRAPC|nr:hypothetical protein BpHYR1_008191 [Brachionus plicatilis]